MRWSSPATVGLSLRERHVIALESLPAIHGDPFDRILIAQAKAETSSHFLFCILFPITLNISSLSRFPIPPISTISIFSGVISLYMILWRLEFT